MSVNLRLFIWLCLLFITGGLFYNQLNTGFNLQTNILKLLPKTEVDPFAEKAFAKFSDNNFKQIILAVSSEHKSSAISGADWLTQQLNQKQLVTSFNSSLTKAEQEELGQLIFKHRFYLASRKDQSLLESQGKEPFVDDTLQLLYSPLSSQLVSLIPHDPLLLSYRYLQYMIGQSSNQKQTEFTDNYFIFNNTVNNNPYSTVLINTTLKNSPFDNQAQTTLSSVIQQFNHEFPQLTLEKTGAIFYAHHAAASAKEEISTIGLGSLIAVILLLIVAFRSAIPLLLTLTSLGFGIFLAFTMVHLTFGSIHILTLVFGSSLVGVAVDYAFHYFASANRHTAPLKHILGAITLGLISSVIGYAALFTAPFPGLQQMAVFCATGLIGAFLTVTLLFDRVPYQVNTPNWLITLFQKHQSFSQKLSHSYIIIALMALPVIASVFLLNTNHDNDNIRQLQSIPPSLAEEEANIKELVAAPATNQFYVVRADTPEQLLSKLEAIEPTLQQLSQNSAIDSFTHIGHFIPSPQRQQQVYQILEKQLSSASFPQLEATGLLTSEDKAQLQQDFREQTPLTIDTWLNSPLGQRFSYLWLGSIDKQWATIVTLNNIQNIPALEQLASNNPDLYFINKVDKVSSLFSNYRHLAMIMLIIAVFVIFILLILKYQFITASYIVLGPIIAASLTIIINILVNNSFNLFSTLALFLVFGIGIDYGLFYAEAKKRSNYINLAIALSAMTTFLSFGLLSLSATPAIHAFGLTMLTGILTVFVLSPILGHRIYLCKGLLEKRLPSE